MKRGDTEEVREYLGAVLDKNSGRALAVVDHMLASKKSMQEIFRVLAAAQVEVGEMWAKGMVSVADEHFATRTTLEGIDIVSERLGKLRVGTRGLALLCTMEGEFHLVGLRMFSELLRDQGWETVMLGSSFSAESLVERAKALDGGQVRLLCISATMPSSLPSLAETLRAIRNEPEFAKARIVVGGPAFRSRRTRGAFSDGSAGSSLVDCVAWGYGPALEFTGSL